MAKGRRITFTEDAAQRIARATLAHERGSRDMSPVRFRQPGGDESYVLIGRPSEDWPKGSSAEIDILSGSDCDPGSGEGGSGSRTQEAWNLLFDVAKDALVVLAQAENGCWQMIAAAAGCDDDGSSGSGCGCVTLGGQDLSKLEGYDEAKTQVLGHEYGCLRWIDTTECDEGSS